MISFYMDLLKQLPSIIWKGFSDVKGLVATAAFILLMFNRPLARRVANWEGISMKWAIVPIGTLILFSILKWNYEKYDQIRVDLAKARTEGEARSVSSEVIASKFIKNKTVRLVDLVDAYGRIDGFVFDGCTLLGPGVIMFTGASVLRNCGILSSPEEFFITVKQERVSGVIELRACTITNSRLGGVAVIGDERSIADIRAQLGDKRATEN